MPGSEVTGLRWGRCFGHVQAHGSAFSRHPCRAATPERLGRPPVRAALPSPLRAWASRAGVPPMSRRLALYAGVPWRFAIVFLIWTTFVTHGTFEFRKPELRSDAYDSLASHLLRGRTDVDPDTINWEGIQAPDGRMFIYFGPLPAMVRWFHLYNADWYGLHARVSCLLAAT